MLTRHNDEYIHWHMYSFHLNYLVCKLNDWKFSWFWINWRSTLFRSLERRFLKFNVCGVSFHNFWQLSLSCDVFGVHVQVFVVKNYFESIGMSSSDVLDQSLFVFEANPAESAFQWSLRGSHWTCRGWCWFLSWDHCWHNSFVCLFYLSWFDQDWCYIRAYIQIIV